MIAGSWLGRRGAAFDEMSRRTAKTLAAGVAATAVFAFGCFVLTVRPLEWNLVLAAIAGFLAGSLSIVVRDLLRWSVASHLTAVGHGMIPGLSSRWAAIGWVLPFANCVLPFAMLRRRWRFYRGTPPTLIAHAQLAFCFAGGWWTAAAVSAIETGPRWPVLPMAAASLSLEMLRRVVRDLSVRQCRAETEAAADRVF